MTSERRRDAGLAVLLLAGLSALFWWGRSRSFGPGDSAQHLLSQLVWGVPHPPGYPLLTGLGWLWSRLPWSDPGAAVNGLSGLLHAAAAAALFLLLRGQGPGRPAALTAAGLMALSPLFWYYSLIAEARALNDLLAIAAAWAALACARSADRRAPYAFAALLGLGVSHHPTFLFIVPALLLFLGKPPPARALPVALAALALPYALLGLRLSFSEPAYNLYSVRGWGDLLPLFLRRDLGGPARMLAGSGFLGFGGFDGASLLRHAGWLASSFWLHAGPAGLALAALGAYSLRERRRELAGWLAWIALSGGAFVAVSSQQLMVCDEAYARGVATRFHLLPLIGVFALAGHGAAWVAARTRPAFAGALALAVFVLPVAMTRLDLSGDDALRAHVRGMIRDSAPGDIVVLGADDSIFAALALQRVHGEGRDRVFLAPSMFSFPPYIREVQGRLNAPPLGPSGLSADWAEWMRLNPGRRVLLEPALRDAALAQFPHSAPQGSLIRVELKPGRSDPRADAERYLSLPELGAPSRWDVRPWTQEVYVLQSRRRMVEWLGSRLDPKRDPDLLARAHELLARL